MSPNTRVIDERHFEFDTRLSEIDARQVRLRFAELMDAAASAAQARGLDQDDVIIERLVWMQADADESPLAVPGLPLADVADWHGALTRVREASGLSAIADSAVCVVRLTLRTVVETDAPLWDGARPDRNLSQS